MPGVGSTEQRLKEKPYEARVCRLERYPNCLPSIHRTQEQRDEARVAGVSMEEEIETMAAIGVDVWVIGGQRDRGWPLFRSKMVDPPEDVDFESTSRFIDLAHEKGMILLSYYPFIFTKPLMEKHPDWMIGMLDDGGEEVWNEGWFCWNSPYRDWLGDYMVELLDCLDLDGLYFDDMNWGSHSDEGQRRTGGCTCKYCRELYLEETGKELPTRVDMRDLDFKRYVNWRYEKFCEGVRHVNEKIHQKHPHAIVDVNYYGRPYGAPDIGWKSAHPMNRIDLDGYLFVEAGLDNLGWSVPAKLCHAHGTSFGVLQFQSQSFPEGASQSAPYPEPYSSALCGLTAVAHGGAYINCAIQITSGGEHSLYTEAAKYVNDEMKKLQPYVERDSVKHVAMHLSQQTRDFGYADVPDDFWRGIKGYHQMLSRSQCLIDYVFDGELTYQTIADYPVLVLPNSSCLTSAQADDIRRYVEDGGTLVATHESSLLDELGEKRENLKLADTLGVDYEGPDAVEQGEADEQDAMWEKNWFGRIVERSECATYLPHDEGLREECGGLIAFGAPQSRIKARPGTGVLCTKSTLTWTKNPPLYNYNPTKNQDSGIPTITVNHVGKGRAIYIAADIGSGYERNPMPQTKRLFAYLVGLADAPLEIDGPNVVEVTAWKRSDDETAVHLLNNPTRNAPWGTGRGVLGTHFYVEELIPVHDIRVQVNGSKVSRAWLPFSNIELDPQQIVVPQLNLQELVLLKLG